MSNRHNITRNPSAAEMLMLRCRQTGALAETARVGRHGHTRLVVSAAGYRTRKH
jgi:hypothetical protein